MIFRDGCRKSIDRLHQHSVPLLIFSAGLGNIIQEVIEQQASIYNTMKIVSNMMKFDEKVSHSNVNKLYHVYIYSVKLLHVRWQEQILLIDWINSTRQKMIFDSFQGDLIGFENDLIHVFNKNENAIHDSDYFKKLEGRNNVILLGDSLGDLKMADGANASILLKIGFLNDKVSSFINNCLEGKIQEYFYHPRT